MHYDFIFVYKRYPSIKSSISFLQFPISFKRLKSTTNVSISGTQEKNLMEKYSFHWVLWHCICKEIAHSYTYRDRGIGGGGGGGGEARAGEGRS